MLTVHRALGGPDFIRQKHEVIWETPQRSDEYGMSQSTSSRCQTGARIGLIQGRHSPGRTSQVGHGMMYSFNNRTAAQKMVTAG